MLALYRCGRQADALEAYREARATLVEQIGVEPGPELQRLQAAILRQDPALAVEPAAPEFPPRARGRGRAAADRPRARAGGAARLLAATAAWSRSPGAYGMGKTRLAAELAARGPARRRDRALRLRARPGRGRAGGDRARGREPAPGAARARRRRPRRRARSGWRCSRCAKGAALVLATGLQAAALARLEPRESLVLEPLDAEAVAAIAGFYAPPGSEIPVDELLRTSRGVARRVHEAASEWARRAATDRVDALAGRTAAGRSEARALESRAGRQRRRPAVDARADRASGRRRAPVICPYKGLASFDRDDAEYFFGREGLVAELVAHLVGAPLLAVVGPSGSGKSSVVRAGLLPALAGGVLPGSQHWAQAVIRPGAHPARELRRGWRARPRRARRRPVRGALHRLPGRARAAEFVAALLRAPRVVVAMRADFYGRCAAYPELSRALGDNHVLVGPMTRDELRRAIERPARRAGLSVEPELADALLADVEGEPGALPLLSTTLLELWGRRDGRRLQLAAYARSGGVQGAVARLAEDAYVALAPGAAAPRRAAVPAPQRRGRGRRDRAPPDRARRAGRRRRRAAHRAPAADGLRGHGRGRARGAPARVAAAARLARRGRRRAAACTTGCAKPRRAWEADARDPGGLYRGAPLAAALDWAAEHGDELDATERAFLEAGRRASGRAQRRLRAGLAGRRRAARARR